MNLTFRTRCLLGFAACAAFVGYALYAQFAQNFAPCDLCILQRVAFAAVGLIFLLAAIHNPRSNGARRGYGLLATIAALTGAGIAARHVWVQLNPPEMPLCGPGIGYMLDTQGISGMLRQVLIASGDCSKIDWSFLGLSMPMWSLLWFVLFAAWATMAAFTQRHSIFH